MKQVVKDALDNMLKKFRDINMESEAARLKVVEGIEAVLKNHNNDTKKEVFKKVETLLED